MNTGSKLLRQVLLQTGSATQHLNAQANTTPVNSKKSVTILPSKFTATNNQK